VHEFIRADDGIHGTGLYAQCAANAMNFINTRYVKIGRHGTAGGVHGQGFYAQYCGQGLHAILTAWRATIHRCLAGGQGLGIGATTIEAALCALSLRQDGVDAVSE